MKEGAFSDNEKSPLSIFSSLIAFTRIQGLKGFKDLRIFENLFTSKKSLNLLNP
jgi:hypothetical protein